MIDRELDHLDAMSDMLGDGIDPEREDFLRDFYEGEPGLEENDANVAL